MTACPEGPDKELRMVPIVLMFLPVLSFLLCDSVSCHYSFFCSFFSWKSCGALLISFAYFLLWEKHSPHIYNQIYTNMLFQYSFFLSFFLKQGFYCFLTHPRVYLIPFLVHRCHFLFSSSPCSLPPLLLMAHLMIIVCISIYCSSLISVVT